MRHPDPEVEQSPLTLFWGFGEVSQAAARSMLGLGEAPHAIKVVTAEPAHCRAAFALGLTCAEVRAYTLPNLAGQIHSSLSDVIIDIRNDASTVRDLIWLKARLPNASICAVLVDAASGPSLLRYGATQVVSASQIAGILLVDSLHRTTGNSGAA